MKRIYVLRHAKSSRDDRGLDDHDRPLSRRGIEACAGLARHCAEAGVRPAVVLCSTAERTRRTLELVAPSLGSAPRILHNRAIYLGGEGAILRLLARQDDA
ncbi:MAG: SixA phosphatase family protein, partial [Arenimonas sp.]